MIKKFKAALAVVLAVVMLTGCTFVYVGDIATVNGEKVYHETFKYMAALAQMYFGAYSDDQNASLLLQYDSIVQSYLQSDISDVINEIGTAEEGESLWEKEISEGVTAEDVLTEYLYDKTVDLKVMQTKAAELGITLSEDEKTSLSDFKGQLIQMLGSLEMFNKALDSIGVTEKTLDELHTDILVAEKLRSSQLATDEAGLTYYKDNYLNVKHILIMAGSEQAPDMASARQVAASVIAELNSGADFEALMETYSDDRDTAGNLNMPEGYVFKDGDFGNPAFEEAAASLSVGAYTRTPVEVNTEGGSYQGYHIIKRYELSDSYYENDVNGIKSTVKTALVSAEIEENEARQYYDDNYTGMRYIFIAEVTPTASPAPEEETVDPKQEALTAATEALERLNNGEDFAALIGEVSDDVSTQNGAAYEDRTGIDEIDEVLDTLAIGEYSKEPIYVDGSVTGQAGYYIVQKTEVPDSYYPNVTSSIVSKIIMQRTDAMIDEWAGEYTIEKNEGKIKNVKYDEPMTA